jgi:uncharacterized protein YjbK
VLDLFLNMKVLWILSLICIVNKFIYSNYYVDKNKFVIKERMSCMGIEGIEKYIELAIESKNSSTEVLEVNWLEPYELNEKEKGNHVVNRGSFIIANGLEEQEANELLDKLQAICGENE